MSAAAGAVSELPPDRAVMVKAASENFPVAALVPARWRGHLLAIYGFARLVDDIGDEAAGDRLAALDWVDAQLDRIYAGGRPAGHEVMVRLAATVTVCGIPQAPLRRLVEANRRDQELVRYETYAQLLDYCSLSAAPVGELVLHVFGLATAERVALSDRVCAALQILEHLQDVGEDYARGRIYLPAEDLRRFGCAEAALGAPVTAPALRQLAAFEGARVRGLLAAGRALTATLPALPRLAVAGYVAGGEAALAELERSGYDVLAPRGRVRRRDFARALIRAVATR